MSRAFALGLFLFAPAAALAMPVNPVVVSGSASFALDGGTLTIFAAPDTIIGWDSFSIAAGESVIFVQSGASSAVANRVAGAGAMSIEGLLLANGVLSLAAPILHLDGSISATGGMQLRAGNPDGYRVEVVYRSLTPGGALTVTGGQLAPGGGSVTLGNGVLTLTSASGGGSIDLTNGAPAVVTLASGEPGMELTLLPTPLPGTLALLASACVALGFARRRRA